MTRVQSPNLFTNVYLGQHGSLLFTNIEINSTWYDLRITLYDQQSCFIPVVDQVRDVATDLLNAIVAQAKNELNEQGKIDAALSQNGYSITKNSQPEPLIFEAIDAIRNPTVGVSRANIAIT